MPPTWNRIRHTLAAGACVYGVVALGCSNTPSDEDLSKGTVTAMHDSLVADLDDLIASATELQASAPTPTGRGWDPTLDAAALASMKAAWVKARISYEHVEGALAPIFPDIDASIDARYDDFLSTTGPDDDPFDDRGVTGLHAAERILYADVTPPSVVALEASLPGYRAAAFPATEAEARELKDELLAKIVADARRMKEEWTPAKVDLPGAFTGLVDLMNEQREKVNKAGNQEEESRYSQRTLADLRANLDGTRKIYAVFKPWIRSKTSSDKAKDGPSRDLEIENGFANLQSIYDSVQGDAFPSPPLDWSSESPSEADLATPFGVLYAAVDTAVDPNVDGSIVQSMNQAGALIGLTQ